MNDGILHEKDEPRCLLPTDQIFSLFDVMAGGNVTCDICGRWQGFSALTPQMARNELIKFGWTFPNGEDICPKCSKRLSRGAVT